MNTSGTRTAGEILFEQYLESQRLPFEFEKEHAGKTKRPDYTVEWNGQSVILDVKDFETQQRVGSFAVIDSYPQIREKIEQGRDKFKQYKEFCCALVLYNAGHGIVMLEQQDIMLGSMHGDSGWEIPFNTTTGVADSSRMRRAFLGRGKMLRPNRETPQNTTISAIITLGRLQPDYIRLLDMVHEPAYRDMTFSELDEEARRQNPNHDSTREVPRVIVWHNAVARISFPDDLFCGPYDSHFGVVIEDDGAFQKLTYRGSQLPARINPKSA